MITNFFIPELNNHDVQELWFQQDGATCHTARATIALLKDTFGDRLISRFGPVNWPPRSCDLTPLDYFLWVYVKSLVYADKPQTLDHLEDNIRRVIADIRPQMLEKVIENWTSRLDYIRASRGIPMPEIIFEITKGGKDNFAIAYIDGSSDRSLSNGGAGIILLLPDGNNYKHKINTGIIASNFTSELMAIREALILYQQDPHVIDSTEGLVILSDSKSAVEAIRNGETNISCDIITLLEQLHSKRKSCILQWIPAHVNIEVTEFDCPRIITSTIARLRTEHLKGRKIHPDKTRSYVQCKHYPDLQLTPNHILECPTVATKLLKMGMVPLRDSLWELLYSPDAPRIAEAVIKTFDGI
ncbi:putative transposable element [Trichonephila clavipes]|nr:putative transposable element [Trichonephila clavipes]